MLIQIILSYSWRFFRYSAPIHWLVHGHMTSNNETVSRQMSWAGNIAKTMTSNGKQFTVTRQMLTAVARDGWNLSAVFKFCFCFVLPYNKSLMIGPLGNSEFCLPRISMFKIHCSPRDQSLSVDCCCFILIPSGTENNKHAPGNLRRLRSIEKPNSEWTICIELYVIYIWVSFSFSIQFSSISLFSSYPLF